MELCLLSPSCLHNCAVTELSLFHPHIECEVLIPKIPKRRCWFKNGCCSSCNASQPECLSVWRTSELRVLWVVLCLLELTVRYRGREWGKWEGNRTIRCDQMWHMMLGWRCLTSNKLYNLQCIVIYSAECAWEFLHFVQILYRIVTVQFKQCIRPIHNTAV